MAAILKYDPRNSFISVGYLIAHHQQWLSSNLATNLHALDFMNLTRCKQLVCGSIHISGNSLDLIMTDVSSVVDADVVIIIS